MFERDVLRRLEAAGPPVFTSGDFRLYAVDPGLAETAPPATQATSAPGSVP